MTKLLACFLLALVPQVLAQTQGAVESPTAHSSPYPAVWPTEMDKSSIPAWAAPGKVRFARWDGGRVETAKAFLSGWAGLNPPDPDVLYTMTNWYDLGTIPLLKKAHINLIWATFSVGFSMETEEAHQAQVRRYIAECHRNGIHVLLYESIANMFWEDMFQLHPASSHWPQIGSDGKPVPYSAGEYDKMGRVTRYMANLSNPEWREYLTRRIDLAIDSGADGLIYDNNFGNSLVDLYQQLRTHIAKRKPDFLVMANFHPDTYVLNRLLNCITTEDGIEPGLYAPSSPGYVDLKGHLPYLQKIGKRFLVNNFGLLRIHETLAEGWKPTMIEDGTRETSSRLVGLMSPPRMKLAMAENMSFGIALEQFVEGRPAHDLSTGLPTAVAVWQAVGEYNQFFAEHEDLYTGARSSAPLAIVLDDRSEGIPLLDGLASRRVPFEILYERDITPQTLSRYKAVALLTAKTVRDSALVALEQFIQAGGQLLAAQDAGTLSEDGKSRQRPSFFSGQLGRGAATLVESNLSVDQLAKTLLNISGDPLVSLDLPAGVLYNITEQPREKRIIVHLLNYGTEPLPMVKLEVHGQYHSAYLVSPDKDTRLVTPHDSDATRTTLQVEHPGIYSVIVLTASSK
jgi:hypothetical protein